MVYKLKFAQNYYNFLTYANSKTFFYKKNLHIWEKSSTFAAVFVKKAVLAVFAGLF